MSAKKVQVKKVPARVSKFGQLDTGELFICVSELSQERPPATIYRKMTLARAGLNAHAENWEGESCNGGCFTINDDEDVIHLM